MALKAVHPWPSSHDGFTPDICTGCHVAEMEEAAPADAADATPAPAEPAVEPPGIPHPVEAGTDCEACHAPGGLQPYPENHTAFTTAMCANCHQSMIAEASPTAEPTATAEATATRAPTVTAEATAADEPPLIPHPIQEGIPCATCHGPDGLKPYPANHASFAEASCTGCHVAEQGGGASVVPTATAQATVTRAAASATPRATATRAAAASATPRATTTQAAADDSDVAPPIPHALTGRDNCLLCHATEGGVKPAPADHAGRTVASCQGCHKPTG